MLDRDGLTDWIARYEAAWRAPGTDLLAHLFTADASYRPDPFAEPVVGLEAIATFWEQERDEGEEFTVEHRVVAVQGWTGVARIAVEYRRPRPATYLDLWIVELADGHLARSFEEWPFFPGQRRVA